MAVETKKIVKLYNSWGEPFEKKYIYEFNEEIRKLGGNVELSIKEDPDGFSLIFEVEE